MRVDTYELRHCIGEGGMGSVWLARDTALGRRVALKFVRAERLGPERVAAFLDEARITARFSHPHIVAVYGLGMFAGQPYVVLEYLEGRSLRGRLLEGRPSPAEAVRIATGIADALATAHAAGVLHRDLKPENVLLPLDGRVRVVDFGLAAAVGEVDGRRVGTPAYMAPERWRGESVPASDLWALGACLFEMLAGAHPYGLASTPAAYAQRILEAEEAPPLHGAEDLAPELVALVTSCLDPDPERRPTASAALAALQRLVGGRVAPTSDEEGPFRGLLPFTEEHASTFHGRDAEVDAFVERLRTEPLLPVVGPSGAGKSSFVFAGVIPRLREQGWWTVVAFRPGADPFGALAARISSRTTTLAESARHQASATLDVDGMVTPPPAPSRPESAALVLADRLRDQPGSLCLALQALSRDRRSRVLLVVDQLEELFTLVPDASARAAFLAALCAAADDPEEPVRVVLTVRDDLLGRIAESPSAARALSRVQLIQPLGADALREALLRPLERVGYRVDDPSLPDRMVADVAGTAVRLPLMQFAAQRLWDRRDATNRLLRVADYEAMGGVAGALAGHADEVVAALGEAQRRDIRTLLLRLVTAEGTRRVLRTADALDGLPTGADVVERLVAARLLVVRDADDGAVVEIAHEALIRTWDRLARWLSEAREDVGLAAEVEEAARRWLRRGSRPDDLYAGDALRDAERLLRHGTGPSLTERARAFLDLSTARANRQQRRRGALVTGAVVALASIAVGSTLAAAAFRDQRAEARAQAELAKAANADALVAAARAAWSAGDPLGAAARVRAALERADSAAGRAAWAELSASPLRWRIRAHWFPYGLAGAADGAVLAVAASDGRLRLVDPITAEAVPIPGTTDIADIAVGADEIFWVDFAGQVGRVDRRTREPRDLGQAEPPMNARVLPLPEGSYAVLVERGASWRLERWDAGRAEPATVDVDEPHVWSFAASPANGLVSWLDRATGRVHLRDAWTLADRGAFPAPAGTRVMAWSPDGRWLAVGGRSLAWLDPAGAPRAPEASAPAAPLRWLGWSPDGATLVGVDDALHVLVWRPGAGEAARWPSGLTGSYRAAAFVGGQLVVADEKELVGLDLGVAATDDGARGHRQRIDAVAFDPAGERLLTGSFDHSLRIWDLDRGREQHVLDAASSVNGVAWSPDGRQVAAATADGRAPVWDVESLEPVASLSIGSEDALGVAFTDDGVAVGGWDGAVRRWALGDDDIPAYQGVRRVDAGLYGFQGVPAGLALALDDGRALLLPDAGPERVLQTREAPLHTVRADATGSRFAIFGFDGRVDVVDVVDGDAITASVAVDKEARGDLSSSGRLLAWSDERGAAVRDLATGLDTPLRRPPRRVSVLALSPDGATVAEAGVTGAVRTYDARTGAPRWFLAGLTAEPLAALTHAGWRGLAGDAVPDVAWALWAAENAVAIDASGPICAVDRQGALTRWAPDGAAPAWTSAPGPIQAVASLDGGCAALGTDGVLTVHPVHGPARALEGRYDRLLRDGDAVLVLGEAGVARFRDGALADLWPTPTPPTAVTVDGDGLLLGFGDGSVARWVAGHEDRQLALRERDDLPVTAIRALPGGLVAVGAANGTLGVWDARTGAPIAIRRELVGELDHLALLGDDLVVGTESGDLDVIDLSALRADRCAVLADVAARSHVTFRDGHVVAADAAPECP